jgi:hypothetical protein
MTSIADSSVTIQTSSRSIPSTPAWFGEVALLVHYLRTQGVLDAINVQVRFARRRFGHFEVIDFVAVLFGYALSGERTLEAFYERLRPWASAFMALFDRDRLPSRSALSRWLTALTVEPVEALRARFLSDLLARPLSTEEPLGGLTDRAGTHYLVFDVDGTREAARQRALPTTADRPVAQRRLRSLCAPGYWGRKRGEVVRTRTTVLQAHTHQWLGTFGHAGNGEYRAELRRAVTAIHAYLTGRQFPPARAILRLDGQYGTGAVLADLAGLAYVTRGQDYHLLDRDDVQTRLHLPPGQPLTHPESGIARALYDCPGVPLGAEGTPCRIVVATRPAGEKPSRVGVTRSGAIYELFVTNLPQSAFTAADVVALYLQRGAFENALADEDQEQDPDRWCSHAAWGQEGRASHFPMGVESAPGTGPSPPAGACTQHRVGSRPPLRANGGGHLPGPRAGVWTSRAGPALESWSLLWSRLSAPAGWDAALSRGAAASGARAPPRSRWEPARGLWGQHPQWLAPVPCGSSVNGKVVPPPSPAR